MTRTVAVVAETSLDGAIGGAVRALRRGADLVEFRLDYLPSLSREEVDRLAAKFGRRAIVTLRSPGEGGAASPLHDGREELLEALCTAGFAYVDAELEADGERIDALRKRAAANGTRVIASYHDLEAGDVDVARERIAEACRCGDVGKVVVRTPDLDATLPLLDLARKLAAEHLRFCLIGVGPFGTLTRVLAEDTEQKFQYAAIREGFRAVPGQLPLATAVRIRGRPKLVTGIVGRPLGHSLSPPIHEAAFHALDLPGVYLPFEVTANELATLFERAKDLRLRGLNVTIPHKEDVLDRVDGLDPIAEAVGAVNAVRFEDGRAQGFNTDVHGFEEALRRHGIRVEGSESLVLGAGGGARAVAYALLRNGAHVAVLNRTRARAEALARHFEGRVAVLEPEDVAADRFDLVVNATPLGMAGFAAESPAPPDVWRHAKAAVDLVYNPRETPFLREAREHGAVAVDGLDMFVHQAAKTFELFTGKPAPLEAMARAAQEEIP